MTEWYSLLNPKLQVPTVEHADSRIMTDSLDVLLFFASNYKEANLLPNEMYKGLQKVMHKYFNLFYENQVIIESFTFNVFMKKGFLNKMFLLKN